MEKCTIRKSFVLRCIRSNLSSHRDYWMLNLHRFIYSGFEATIRLPNGESFTKPTLNQVMHCHIIHNSGELRSLWFRSYWRNFVPNCMWGLNVFLIGGYKWLAFLLLEIWWSFTCTSISIISVRLLLNLILKSFLKVDKFWITFSWFTTCIHGRSFFCQINQQASMNVKMNYHYSMKRLIASETSPLFAAWDSVDSCNMKYFVCQSFFHLILFNWINATSCSLLLSIILTFMHFSNEWKDKLVQIIFLTRLIRHFPTHHPHPWSLNEESNAATIATFDGVLFLKTSCI